jgi:ArsR family transcriptional regulator
MSSMDKGLNIKILNEFQDCIPAFLVLSDEARQTIVLMLADNIEGLNVNRITENMHLSRPAISHHLKILKQAGIINVEKKGTENYYFLTLKDTVEKIKKLIQMVEENCVLK